MLQSRIAVCILCSSALLNACTRVEPRVETGAARPTDPKGNVISGDSIGEIVTGGQTRQYRLHLPSSYQAGQPTALVINLHGASSNAAQQERVSGMSTYADQTKFIVVYPEGLGSPQTWHFGPEADGQADLQFMRELIGQLSSQYTIDAARVYATGISNGAQETNHLGCELADRIAAIGPVSGGYFRGEPCQPRRPVPVVAFHGTADRLLPYDGIKGLMLSVPEWAASWAALNGCTAAPTQTFQHGQVTGQTWGSCRAGADVILYTVNGGGHSWPGSDVMPAGITTQDINATDTMWKFFVAHPKP